MESIDHHHGHLAVCEELASLFDRGLVRLRTDIVAFKDESTLWVTSGDVSNSAGTLCLHIVGNLLHFVGAQIGGSNYVRDREAEFGDRNVAREELLGRIDNARMVVASTLVELKKEDLDGAFDNSVFSEPVSMRMFLMHLVGHLWYHAGQVNYHRRLLDR